MFSSTIKRKADVTKFLGVKSAFEKLSFSWRIRVNGRPHLKNNVRFQIFPV